MSAGMEGNMVLPILLPQVLHLKFMRPWKIFFFNVPDIDNTNSHREAPSKSQRTPTPWPQRVRLGKIPDRRALLSGRKSALEMAMRNYADRAKPSISRAVSVDSLCSLPLECAPDRRSPEEEDGG